ISELVNFMVLFLLMYGCKKPSMAPSEDGATRGSAIPMPCVRNLVTATGKHPMRARPFVTHAPNASRKPVVALVVQQFKRERATPHFTSPTWRADTDTTPHRAVTPRSSS